MLKKHRDNLLKLANYLVTLPDDYEKFDMSIFMEKDGDRVAKPAPTSCGTVACAVGHGPTAGIRVYRDLDWLDYAKRAFGVKIEGNYSEFDWMFGEEWGEIDNTAKGAADRIYHFLENGVPHEDSELWRGRG